LFLEPARQLPQRRFCLGGALYPAEFPWTDNVFFVRHLPAAEHSEFYSSSRWTLNVTRAAMADMGYCPSARFFEAAACGTPVLTDWFEGLDYFFNPWSEVVVAHSTDDATAALEMTEGERTRMARAARDRTLEEHTADARVVELEGIFERALSRSAAEVS
jgi:spore maturation protein CgeB